MPKSKGRHSSSTPGKAKGLNCQKTPLKVQLAKHSRFRKKDPLNYANACKESDALMGVKSWTTRVADGESIPQPKEEVAPVPNE